MATRGAATTHTDDVPFGALIARLGQDSIARLRRALRPLGLSAHQFIVLKQLQSMGPSSQAALADAVGVDYSNLATVAGEFCSRGVIDRRRDESDRRRYVLEVSEQGARLIADCDRTIADGEDEMLAALTTSEREQLYSLLRRVADSAELCPTAASACDA
jgi:MarR family transcriptional regulator, lower aerobic nicotinate degradation pathway regulator